MIGGNKVKDENYGVLLNDVVKKLNEQGKTIATAESCTGGMIGSILTEVSGVSDIYMGGAVTYSNQAKMDMIGVKKETLDKFGAVSKETALEMAGGIRKVLNTSFGVSSTGVAGPTGGTPEKPVGLVYIAICGENIQEYKELRLEGTRQDVRCATCIEVLKLIYKYVGGN
jgi:nicotinamide-nucleotide amidase